MRTSRRPSAVRRAVHERRAVIAARKIRLQHDRPPAGGTHGLGGGLGLVLRSLIGQRDIHPAARERFGNDGANPLAAGD